MLVSLSRVVVSVKMSQMLRRAECPNEDCHGLLLFYPISAHVKCRRCPIQLFTVQQLGKVVVAKSMKEEQEWLEEKASHIEMQNAFGCGRSEMANRMIDGILSSAHASIMSDFFEVYGISGGKAQKLAEMGRIEPFNVSNLSDYAFGLRTEHFHSPR